MAYATDEGDKYYYEIAAPEAEGRNIGRGTVRHEMPIFDARTWPEPLTLDVHGFELLSGPSPPIEFLDDACVKRLYYPAMEKLARQCIGAARIHIFDHTVRHGDPEVRRANRIKGPATGVHNDYTHWSARKRVRDLLAATRLRSCSVDGSPSSRRGGRSAIGSSRTRSRSRTRGTVEESDFVPVPRTAPGRVGETWRALYNPKHRFFYYPHLTPHEAIFFKVYDSATDGRARYTLHTAFELPDPDPNAAPRHSVEMRLLALVLIDPLVGRSLGRRPGGRMNTREHVEALFRRFLQSGRLKGLPRNPEHLDTMLAVATGGLIRRRPHAESEVNEVLADWLSSVRADIDHVTLRRRMVDCGFLKRTTDRLAVLSELRSGCGCAGRSSESRWHGGAIADDVLFER